MRIDDYIRTAHSLQAFILCRRQIRVDNHLAVGGQPLKVWRASHLGRVISGRNNANCHQSQPYKIRPYTGDHRPLQA